MDFDYISAWHAIAFPKYLQLPREFREARVKAIELLKDEKQKSDTLDIPLLPEVVSLFEGFDSEILSRASYLVYFLGHWFPARDCPEELRTFGEEGSWKVSNVLDQMLHKRLELPRNRKGKNPHAQFFVNGVHEGRIRVAFSTNGLWTWEEVCWATHIPELPALAPRGDNFRDWEWECQKVLDNWAKEMRAKEPNWYDTTLYKKRG